MNGYFQYRVTDKAGIYVGDAVPHPRIEGMWMAMWKPLHAGDCGMKRYKTRRGAIRRVLAQAMKVAS